VKAIFTVASLWPPLTAWAVWSGSGLAWVCLVAVPNALVMLRLMVARSQSDRWEIVVGRARPDKDGMICGWVVLGVGLLPVGPSSTAQMLVGSAIFVAATLALKVRCVDPMLLLMGFRAFVVESPEDGNPYTGRKPLTVLARREFLSCGSRLVALRLDSERYLIEPAAA
jgi:hypothetical protein